MRMGVRRFRTTLGPAQVLRDPLMEELLFELLLSVGAAHGLCRSWYKDSHGSRVRSRFFLGRVSDRRCESMSLT